MRPLENAFTFLSFAIVFGRPSGSLVHIKIYCHVVPNGKVQNVRLFGLLSLLPSHLRGVGAA